LAALELAFMGPGRVEPYQLALGSLREQLRDGRLAPASRVTAKDVAQALRLSPTPVREALARLAGEGLLDERRGDGFFVPCPSAAEVADLYRISSDLLRRAQAADRQPRRDLSRPLALEPGADPVRAVERLLATWAAESASRVLVERYRSLAVRLSPLRRLEPPLLPDLRAEAEALLTLAAAEGRGQRPDAIAAFHERRIALADRLAHALDPDGSMQV
jgi:DNA-binding transcriptional MocR family regulator